MTYKYIAYTEDRTIVKGSLNVDEEDVAKEVLQQSGYSVLSLKFVSNQFNLKDQLPMFFGVKVRDVVSFSRMLATLISRGTNTLVALQLIRDQVGNQTFKQVIHDVSEDVRRGVSLSNAMRRHPNVFPSIYCQTIEASAQTGKMEDALRYMSDYLEAQSALTSKVSRSLAYPAFVLVVGIGVVILLMTFTLPSMSGLFTDLEGDLPLPTKILVSLSGFLNSYILYIIGFIIVATLMVVFALKKPSVQFQRDSFLIRMPLIGKVVMLREMINFSRTMSTCLASSISMPDTLELSVQTASNLAAVEAIEHVREEVLQGRGLSQAMKQNQIFPSLLVQVVRTGEEAGTLDEDLNTVIGIYETDVDTRVNTLISILTPGILLFLGAFVAFIAVSMVAPIYAALEQVE